MVFRPFRIGEGRLAASRSGRTDLQGAEGCGEGGLCHHGRMSGEIPYAAPEILDQHLEVEHLPLVFDCFREVLPFGTSGRRGPVGYGPNRMNPSTIAMTAQGHSNYLRGHNSEHTHLERNSPKDPLSVVVANDVRYFTDNAEVYRFLGSRHPLIGLSSRSLARLACEIYAANGMSHT